MIGFGGDGDTLAAEMKVAVEQRVLQLAAAAADRGGDRAAGNLGQQGNEPVGRLQRRQSLRTG